MTKTVIGLVQKPGDAQRVIDDLIGICGCDRADIGVLARGARDAQEGEIAKAVRQGGEVASETAAALGTLAGSILGALAGVVSRTIPGTGPLVAAGPIAMSLARVGAGAAASLFEVLRDVGMPEEKARYYSDAVSRGGIVITVRARTDRDAKCAEQVMTKLGVLEREAQGTR
jgi:hypothetical protein